VPYVKFHHITHWTYHTYSYIDISLYTIQVRRFQVNCSIKCTTVNSSQHYSTKSSSFIGEECHLVRLICGFAGPSGCTVEDIGLWPLACWDCGFESHRGHECLSVVIVVCCQVEVSATSWSLVQRSPTTVVRRCVWSRNLVNEEALAHWGLLRPKIIRWLWPLWRTAACSTVSL